MSKKEKFQTQDSNTAISVTELANKMQFSQDQKIKELENKCFALNETLTKFVKALEDKEEEIAHLKHLLYKGVPIIGEAIAINISDEELIADIQLNKLKVDAKIRKLTLEEIKIFDLLVKNKRLARGDATDIPGKPKDDRIKSKDSNTLLKIASKKVE
jgi:hypothetical protein